MKDAFKRKSTITICIGFVLYVILICIPAVTFDVIANLEDGYDFGGGSDGAATLPLIAFYYYVPVLIGLVELICAIANKKAVFVLSVIQAVVSVLIYVLNLMMFSDFKSDGSVVSYSNIVYLPIVACALLLVGGIMFRKEKAVTGGAN